MIFLIILFYFGIGIVFACLHCAICSIPTPPDMSEEDKNIFALIVAFWAILIPVKFVRRLCIAIKTLFQEQRSNWKKKAAQKAKEKLLQHENYSTNTF